LALLLENCKVNNLSGYGIDRSDSAIGNAGALILYATDNLRQKPRNITQIQNFQQQDTMIIETNTARNLELFRSGKGGQPNTFLSVIDDTKTAVGARSLEKMAY
jgi:DNA mismatch repair ATPase MutS